MCSYFFAQSYMCEMLIYLNLSINYNIHNFFIFFPKLFSWDSPLKKVDRHPRRAGRWICLPECGTKFITRECLFQGMVWGGLLARTHGLVHKILDSFTVLQLVNFKGVRHTSPKQKRSPPITCPSLTCSSLPPPLTEQKALGFTVPGALWLHQSLFSVIMILPITLLFKLNHDLSKGVSGEMSHNPAVIVPSMSLSDYFSHASVSLA